MMANKEYTPITFGADEKTAKNIDDLMNLTRIHNRSHLIRLVFDYFIKNKDKIEELIKK